MISSIRRMSVAVMAIKGTASAAMTLLEDEAVDTTGLLREDLEFIVTLCEKALAMNGEIV